MTQVSAGRTRIANPRATSSAAGCGTHPNAAGPSPIPPVGRGPGSDGPDPHGHVTPAGGGTGKPAAG